MSDFRINTNTTALATRYRFGQAQAKMETAIERLSSGLRINSAKDDAAGLAISSRMQNQIRGMKMAGQNIKSGADLIQTAEGGMNQIQSILGRMRELAVQSASDTMSLKDRASSDLEYKQLIAEIDRISASTEYNGTKLLDGNGGSSLEITDGEIRRVSVASDGTESNVGNWNPRISGDGRYITFSSSASNLVDNDTNSARDIFVHDTQTGSTTRVSLASDGSEGNDNYETGSLNPSISSDGRYIAFVSDATNLVDNDTNGEGHWGRDVFLHDTKTGATSRVSVSSSGDQATGSIGSLSSVSDFGNSISGDGRYVAFSSGADNLVDNDTNGHRDTFVHDTQTGVTTRVSLASDGDQLWPQNVGNWNPSISSDGRYITFRSNANNLVDNDTNGGQDVFVQDIQTGTTTHVAYSNDSSGGSDAISSDGRYIAFGSDNPFIVDNDTNNASDVFLHDTQTGITTRVSVASEGTQANGFSYLHPSISGDGRYVVFYSEASNLVDNDTNGRGDIFVHDTQTGTTNRVNVASDGTQSADSLPTGTSYLSDRADISGDGRYITFSSGASNLVDNDTNNTYDVFRVANPLYEPTATEITLQIGANNSDEDRLSLSIKSTTADNLSLTDSSLSTLEGAQSAINSLDDAINFINDQRSNLGAVTNRLEFAHSNVYSGIQNTEASLSTIRDADFAEEAANLAKSQILTQASSAMLAQANNLSQNILSLLR